MITEVKISDIKIERTSAWNELSGSINGDTVYYRIPAEYEIHLCAEGFVALALMEAMVSNVPIVLDRSVPLSQKLYVQLHELQAIYSGWNRDLHIVAIEADTTTEKLESSLVGSMFSGGVDSSYTLLQKKSEITHLIMCSGFDSESENAWNKKLELQSRFSQSVGKKLLPVVSNAREWIEGRRISWLMGHGLFLSTLGGMLGMSRIYIPASHTYDELFPWGSHVLSDPMWSTESSEVIHHGARRRSQKVESLLSDEFIVNNLQVCWRDIQGNCGECSKCVRTMIAVTLLDGEVKALPALTDLKLLSVLNTSDDGLAVFVEDLIILAKEKGHEQIYKKLRNSYRRYQLKLVLPQVDRYLFGGAIRRLSRKRNKPGWADWRVTLRGSNRWDI
jgi:hypothetical protein